MSYYDEERKRRQRWPWPEIDIHPEYAVSQRDDGRWQTGEGRYPSGGFDTEDAAREWAMTQSRQRYQREHAPDKYRGRYPVLYVEPDRMTDWDHPVAMIPIPTLGGMQAGGYLVIDQSVDPPKE